jgi:hypothetical protein
VGFALGGTTAEEQVTEAALRRAAALAARDETALRVLMHPSLQWTTLRGEVLGYEDYIVGNTRGDLWWRSQRLADIQVRVVGDAAVLTATVTDEITRDGQDRSFDVRLTQMWVRTPDGWRCLAGHACVPVQLAHPVGAEELAKLLGVEVMASRHPSPSCTASRRPAARNHRANAK